MTFIILACALLMGWMQECGMANHDHVLSACNCIHIIIVHTLPLPDSVVLYCVYNNTHAA